MQWINIANVYKTLLILSIQTYYVATFLCDTYYVTTCFPGVHVSVLPIEHVHEVLVCLHLCESEIPPLLRQGESAAGHQLMLTSAPCQLTALWARDLNMHQPHTYNVFPFISVSLSPSLAL